ncbi:MAG: fibronectin type III domain-containing protein [Gemmatimonadales bacterium]
MTPNRLRSDRAGFSLVELLVTLVVLSMIMGTTVLFFRNQNQAFLKTSERMDLLQNARYSVSQVERILRTLGSGVTGQQPMLVYGDDKVIAFNTDYTETDTTDFRWAVNWNPSVPTRETIAWLQGDAGTIPNSSYTYPPQTFLLGSGATSPAETKMFYFSLDSTTTRSDDYVLWERTNSGTGEYIARNILPYPGRPFLEFFISRRLSSGADTLILASGSLLPLKRLVLQSSFTSADTANAVRPDSVRAIRINIRVTNGATGADERTRDFTQTIQVPNNGLPSPNVCGRSPFAPSTFTATPDTLPGSGAMTLAWNRSVDHGGGEYDVRQYILYQRDDTATVWRDPLMMVRADTTTAYSIYISGLVPGAAYDFGLAAQDCTPSQSTIAAITATAP